MAVLRCYTEKRSGFDSASQALCANMRDLLEIPGLTYVRELCRYDVEGIDAETYAKAKNIVFSEPMVDSCYDEQFPMPEGDYRILAVEPLPGQYDQRSDSCAQCIQMMTQGERPQVAAAHIYVLGGKLTDAELDKIRGYLINPVDSREASADKPETLEATYAIPTTVDTVTGFIAMDTAALEQLRTSLGLAMELDDLEFLQRYFAAPSEMSSSLFHSCHVPECLCTLKPYQALLLLYKISLPCLLVF